MSANIYNHRTLQPAGRSGGGGAGPSAGGPPPSGPSAPIGISGPGGLGPAAPNSIAIGVPPPPPPSSIRLNDSLEIIKAEFDAMAQEIEAVKSQKDEVEVKLGSQVTELNHIRRCLYDLETQQMKVRQQYEDELTRLRAELTAATRHTHPVNQGIASLGGPSAPFHPNTDPSAPSYTSDQPNGRIRDLPPSLEARIHGPKDGCVNNGSSGSSGNSNNRERDRDPQQGRERDRDREIIVDRSRDRERDRNDRRDFEVDRDRERDRDMDRLADQRDPKRVKKDNGPSSSYAGGSHTTTPRLPPSHALYGPAGGPPSASPYTAGAPPPLGHPANGAGIPPPPGAGASISAPPLAKSENSNGGLSALGLGGPLPPPQPGTVALAGQPMADEFNYSTVPPEYRKDGQEWFAAFNPKIKRNLDIHLVHSFQHSSVVCCVQFSQDGRFLATGCNQTAQIYDTKSGVKVCELPHESEAHSGDLYIRSVRFSPDGKLLATGAEDRQIRIWDIGRKRIRHVFDGHQQEIYSLDFSQDGRLIVSGSGDRTTRIWDMEEKKCKVFTITDVVDQNTDAGVTSVAISPSTALVAAGSLDNIIRIWDVATGQLLERLRGHTNSVYSVAFTPDGKGLVTGSLDKTLKLWDVSHLNSAEGRRKAAADPDMRDRVERERMERMEREGKIVQSANCVMDFIGHKDYVLSVSMSSDSRWVVSGSKDRCVHVWDSNTATLQLMLQGHKNSVISLDLNSNNDLLATGSGDSFARIWSLVRT
ncbi:WD40 repeat-like protein [Coprinopsis marcescibilis]|uniref:WD40 repeat-like protein n=1 Tax=Coprinopsis marcescibilis TaxID=230819 RepID=A0A5C3KBL4_COPMA|nr:WD40 repeat-like protein [Coprinopsis marcescibilis]